ncbi:MAG: AglZ/HisF2 family acetamidino modification protein [Litorimonas sp.]
MLRTRVIPALQLHDRSLVKAKQFGKFRYIGDPANTVRIFNELEVDELCFLDISAARKRRGPNFDLLRDVASECFMPLSYGGGIRDFDTAKRIYDTGFEKVVINTAADEAPGLIEEISRVYGTQAVVASIDVKADWLGRIGVYTRAGRNRAGGDPVAWARQCEDRGAGEILLTSIAREGTYQGFDLDLVSRVSAAVDVPVIAHGGAGALPHIRDAVDAGASAVALGSMVVFQKQDMGVLVNFPSPAELDELLS